jgi:hypothetical protein
MLSVALSFKIDKVRQSGRKFLFERMAARHLWQPGSRCSKSACPPLPHPRWLQPPTFFLEDNTVPVVNLCFAGVLMPALVVCCALFFYRVYRWERRGFGGACWVREHSSGQRRHRHGGEDWSGACSSMPLRHGKPRRACSAPAASTGPT